MAGRSWIIAILAAMSALNIVTTSLRLVVRSVQKQKLWSDDWLIIVATAWNLLVVGSIIAMLQHGLATSAATLSVPELEGFSKWLLVGEILYVSNQIWYKFSFLMLYYRIIPLPYFKRWVIGVGAFIIAWVIIMIFLFVFDCDPPQAQWDLSVQGKCRSLLVAGVANSISTIISDLAILLLPMPQIWKLRLPVTERLGICMIFALGLFVVFCSAFRLRVMFFFSTLDPTLTVTDVIGWTELELAGGIISANLITFRPLVVLFLRGKLPSVQLRHRETGKATRSDDQSQHIFYHLPPQSYHAHQANATSSVNTGQVPSDDELLLRDIGKIHVQHDYSVT